MKKNLIAQKIEFLRLLFEFPSSISMPRPNPAFSLKINNFVSAEVRLIGDKVLIRFLGPGHPLERESCPCGIGSYRNLRRLKKLVNEETRVREIEEILRR